MTPTLNPFLSAPLLRAQINPIALGEQKVELMESIISSMPEWKTLTTHQK